MPDTAFLLALGAAILSAASIVLHVVAPRTKATWDDKLRDDIDEVLAFARAQKTATIVPPKDPQAGFIDTGLLRGLAAISAFGLAIGLICGLACGSTTKAVGKAVLANVIDCTTADRAKLEAQFGPAVEQAILRATGGDGRIDLPSLQQLAGPLEADGWCVLEHVVAQLIAAATAPKVPGAPASAAAPLDAQDLAAQLARMRISKFGATRFDLGAAP